MILKIKAIFQSKINTIGLPIIALCWVSFFWGTTWIASKEGVKHMPALQLVAIRQFIGGGLYIAYFLFKNAPWPRGKQWKTILILSVLNFMISNALSTWGVKYITSSLGAIIGAIVPLWIVIITFFGGERLPKLTIMGLMISFGGICIVFYDHLNDFLQSDFRFGIFISVISTLAWAFGSLYTKKKVASFNPYFSIGLQMFISSLIIFAIIGATDTAIPLSAIPAISWCSIAYLVVFGAVLTFVAFIYALQHLPAAISSIYAYINPIVAVILGSIIFGEVLNVAIATGGIVTLFGLYLVNYAMRKARK